MYIRRVCEREIVRFYFKKISKTNCMFMWCNRTSKLSNFQAFGQINLRISWPRTNEPSDFWTVTIQLQILHVICSSFLLQINNSSSLIWVELICIEKTKNVVLYYTLYVLLYILFNYIYLDVIFDLNS